MRRGAFVSILLGAVLALGPSALAAPGDITLASTSDSGVKGNSFSFTGFSQSVSGDGTKVVFSSFATNLDPADTDSIPDVYVKDLTTGDITLVSTSDTGVKGNSGSIFPNISADGSAVAFSSRATNFDPADTTDENEDIYVKDLTTGEITLANTSDAGVKGDSPFEDVSVASISADGSVVAFSSIATNLDPADTDSIRDAYVKDLTTGDIMLASTSDTGIKGNSFSDPSSLSADGTVVAFTSGATNLDPADSDSIGDVYVKDLTTGDVALVSTSDTGVKGNSGSGAGSLSADGTRVALNSLATNLDPADSDSLGDVYVKDLTTGDVTLVSTSDTGVKGNSGSSGASLSGEGTRVAFLSDATNFDPADSDSLGDVYVKDLTTGDITLASTSDAGVKANDSSIDPFLSADGTKVAFYTGATNLDPADTDFPTDVYVKDLGGPCTITGTLGDDTLRGTRGDDVICGLGGKDTLKGLGGDDLLLGADGADRLIGGAGSDTLRGDAGPDRLNAVDGVSGNDLADGGGETDHCRTDPGDTLVACP